MSYEMIVQIIIDHLQEECHKTAVDKGWYNPPRTIVESICLVHTELSEAVEEVRNNKNLQGVYWEAGAKPYGFAVELADVLIRIFDMAEYHKIPLGIALREKMAYNKTRPHRHGGKAL